MREGKEMSKEPLKQKGREEKRREERRDLFSGQQGHLIMKEGLDLEGLLLVGENGVLQEQEAAVKEIGGHGEGWCQLLL